jgi:hypothetical protein
VRWSSRASAATLPYIVTHAEFREEVREMWEMLDRAVPRDQVVPAGRARFEAGRRASAAGLL